MQWEAFDVRIGCVVPFRLMPSAAHDPITGLGLLRRTCYLGDDLLPRFRFTQIEAEAVLADAGKMPMAFDESWNRELAVEVDHACVWSRPPGGVGVASQRRDAIPSGRE